MWHQFSKSHFIHKLLKIQHFPPNTINQSMQGNRKIFHAEVQLRALFSQMTDDFPFWYSCAVLGYTQRQRILQTRKIRISCRSLAATVSLSREYFQIPTRIKTAERYAVYQCPGTREHEKQKLARFVMPSFSDKDS